MSLGSNLENQGIGYVVNPEKNETITVDGVEYRRLCIKTHVITDQDNIVEVADKYAGFALLFPAWKMIF